MHRVIILVSSLQFVRRSFGFNERKIYGRQSLRLQGRPRRRGTRPYDFTFTLREFSADDSGLRTSKLSFWRILWSLAASCDPRRPDTSRRLWGRNSRLGGLLHRSILRAGTCFLWRW